MLTQSDEKELCVLLRRRSVGEQLETRVSSCPQVRRQKKGLNNVQAFSF